MMSIEIEDRGGEMRICQEFSWKFVSQINNSRFIHRKTAAMGPLSIERALKTDLLTILAAYQNILIPINKAKQVVHINILIVGGRY